MSAAAPTAVSVVVNTCAGYEGATVPALLRSLRAAGVPMGRVHVVVGESAAPRDEQAGPEESWFHYRRTCAIDNNGLVWASTEPGPAPGARGWIVYLHDTCAVDAEFWRKATEAARRFDGAADCVAIHAPFSMSLGLYSVAWLQSAPVRGHVRAAVANDDCSPERKAAKKNEVGPDGTYAGEDTLFKWARAGHGRFACLPVDRRVVEEGVRAYGADAAPRIKEYYPHAGVYKLKANWGQSATLHTNL